MSFGPWDQIRSESELRYQGNGDSAPASVEGPLHGFAFPRHSWVGKKCLKSPEFRPHLEEPVTHQGQGRSSLWKGRHGASPTQGNTSAMKEGCWENTAARKAAGKTAGYGFGSGDCFSGASLGSALGYRSHLGG